MHELPFCPKLIVGLGNPGRPYHMTRHNFGFLVVTALAKKMDVGFSKSMRFTSDYAKGRIAEKDTYLLMPKTFMNASGEAVKQFAEYYKILPQELIVVVDDIALGFGTMRLKKSGSDGGHNGLKSIQACIGTSEYPRLRLGIGPRAETPAGEMSLVSHVLGTFGEQEQKLLPDVIDKAINALEMLFYKSFEMVANACAAPN